MCLFITLTTGTVPGKVYKEDVHNESYIQYICSSHRESATISFAVYNIVERSSHKGKSQRVLSHHYTVLRS